MTDPQPLTTQQPGRLTAAARRALDALNDLIHDSTDPGTEALAARFELEQALLNGQQPPADIDPATVATLLADQRTYERRLREQHDLDVAELNRLRAQNRVLVRSLTAKDARTGDGDQQLREFLTAGTDDDEAASFTGTRPCGHDDYHDPHNWHERPGLWCPGISTADAEPAAARPAATTQDGGL